MPGKLVQNDETGEWGIWDGQNLTKLPGKVVTNESTGAKALWDGKSLTPVNVQLDMNQPGAAQDKAQVDKLLTPQQLEQKTSPIGFAQAPQKTGAQVMETLNAPIEAATTAAGRAVQKAVEPYVGGTGSDIAGAVTKEGLQFFGPQLLSTGARLLGKGAAMLAPGAQGGKMESLIGKTEGALSEGLSAAQRSQAGYERAFSKSADSRIPLNGTLKTIDDMIAHEAAHGIQGSGIVEDLNNLKRSIQAQAGAPTLAWIDDEMTRVGEKTKMVQGMKPNPAYKKIFASMASDLEQLPTSKFTAGNLLRAKDESIRHTKGYEDLIDEFNNLVKTKRGMAGQQDINANQLMDKLKKNQFLQESLKPEDWKEINPLLEKLADTAALPAPRGASYGSGRALGRGAVAGGLAYMAGGDPATVATVTTALDYGVGQLMMTRQGRSLIKAILNSPAYEPSQKLNIVNGMGRLAEKGYNALGNN